MGKKMFLSITDNGNLLPERSEGGNKDPEGKQNDRKHIEKHKEKLKIEEKG